MAALILALAVAPGGRAATGYVTDELVLGVYPDASTEGPRLATLHSGATVETLEVKGDATQVRLADGVIGWVKSAYLTTAEPAVVRLKQLQDELARARATTPRLAEAAERTEVARLTHELALQAQAGSAAAGMPAGASGTSVAAASLQRRWAWALSVLLALGAGFWLGYAALARRIKTKFGGIKVY
jgi:SH3 domain protein